MSKETKEAIKEEVVEEKVVEEVKKEAKKEVKTAPRTKKTVQPADCYYRNSTGTYKYSAGKLYNDKDERVSVREISSRKDPLKKSDKKGEVLAKPLVVEVKPVE